MGDNNQQNSNFLRQPLINLPKRSNNKFILTVALGIVVVLVSWIDLSYAEDIRFNIGERFTEKFKGPEIYLHVETIKRFGDCPYVYLDHDFRLDKNNIRIKIKGVVSPEACLKGYPREAFQQNASPSFQEILNIGNGNYVLEFSDNKSTDRYSIQIFYEKIIIKPLETEFTEVEQTEVSRFPKDLLWANCFYNDSNWIYKKPPDAAAYCSNFFSELGQIAKVYLEPDKNKVQRNGFYIYSEGDQPIIDLVKKYRRYGFYVSVGTYAGKLFQCCGEPSIAGFPVIKIEYEPAAIMSEQNCKINDVECYSEAAFNLKNEKICEQLPFENQGRCFAAVGIAKDDLNLCDKSGKCWTCRGDCYTGIAIQRSDPTICEKLGNSPNILYKNNCYAFYAEAKKS